MALISRLAILGAAGAAAAWFLKQRQDSGESYGGSSAGSAGASQAVEPEQVGDAAAAGTGASETVSESSDAESGSDATRVSDVVVPDTGSDPLVREQEKEAAAEAGSIGGSPETTQSSEDPGQEPVDPGMKPVIEASGEEHETLVENDAARGASREREGSDQPAP